MNNWNTNTGWRVGGEGSLQGRVWDKNIGQMMNTRMEYITHYDTYVQVRDSTANVYVNFLFDLDQFIFIGSNNRLIVQLLPTDPAKYEYYPGTCEVDPARSDFVPYMSHELISRPFMGTFVSGDVRNWNIFRVLGDPKKVRDMEMGKDKFNSEEESNVSGLSYSQLERLINLGKKHSQEHKIFTRLRSKFFTKMIDADVWSSKSRAAIKDVGDILENLYDKIGELLQENYNENTFSHFHQKRVKLTEISEKAKSRILTVLNSSADSKDEDRLFLQEMSRVVDFTNELLQNTDKESLHLLKKELQEVMKSFNVLLSNYMGLPLAQDKDAILQSAGDQSVDRHFNTDIVPSSDNPEDWSGINMTMFAQDEGLKVITLDDEQAVHQLLTDLNETAQIHNEYHLASQKEKNRHRDNQERENIDIMDLESCKREYQEIKESGDRDKEDVFESNEEILAKVENYQKRCFFPVTNGDDYFALEKKINEISLPDINVSSLTNIVKGGVHASTLNNPEVMAFLHSLCGFWFDKFYENYMEQRQMDIIHDKHMDHFQYYKSTLQYFTEEGLLEQYKDLYQAMQQYHLKPMDQSRLVAGENPFTILQNNEEVFNLWEALGRMLEGFGVNVWNSLFGEQDEEPVEELYSGTVVESLYKSHYRTEELARAIRVAAAAGDTMGGYGAMKGAQLILEQHRHPYFKCMANPLNFFHVEKKVIVGDIGSRYSDLIYEYGRTASVNTQVAFDYAYSATWNMSRSFSTSIGTGFAALGFLGGDGFGKLVNPISYVSPVFSFAGIDFKSQWSTSKSASEQNRRQSSLRFSNEALYLHTHQSAISVRLKNFRHCLIVRAKNLAFDGYDKDMIWREDLAENFIHQLPYIKSGLLICSEDIDAENREDPFYITEDYFYLYQTRPGDSQFFNLFSYRNRPFVLAVRGQTEMEKLSFLVQSFVEADKVEGIEDYDPFGLMTNPYNTVSKPAEGTQRAIEKAKVWDKTGFYPGVYSVSFDHEHYFFRDPERRDPGMLERVGKWFEKNNPFGFMRFDDSEGITNRSTNQ